MQNELATQLIIKIDFLRGQLERNLVADDLTTAQIERLKEIRLTVDAIASFAREALHRGGFDAG